MWSRDKTNLTTGDGRTDCWMHSASETSTVITKRENSIPMQSSSLLEIEVR